MNLKTCWYKNKCNNECRNGCVRYNLIYSLFLQSELPEPQWVYKDLVCSDADYNAFCDLNEIKKNIESFVSSGGQLYIHSANCGNGKTSWSIRLMWAYFDKIWHKSSFDCKAVFVNVQKFLYNCKRNISQDVKGFEELCNKIEKADLVIWDDLPCSRFTDYEHQILFQYIDDRITNGKSNIFTGNENIDGCRAKLGDKLTSRITSGYVVQFLDGDKRGDKQW